MPYDMTRLFCVLAQYGVSRSIPLAQPKKKKKINCQRKGLFVWVSMGEEIARAKISNRMVSRLREMVTFTFKTNN